MPEIDIRNREKEDRPNRRRSVLVSPDLKFSPPGSRWGSFSLSFSMLRQLAKLSPTVQAIIRLRQAQVAAFARAPRHKGDRGFEIVRGDGEDMKQHDDKVAKWVFEFLMGTGAKPAWERHTLPSWIRASIRDLLIIGAFSTELVYDENGRLTEFWDIDAATIELQWAERYIPTTRYGRDMDQPVRYVQVYDGQVETEYAEDELMYVVGDPVTDLQHGGYGISPTDGAADWISAEVLALQYNSNYFDHGSVPPGILALIGNLSEDTMDSLNTMWQTDVKGVVGQHKPVALAVEPSANGGSSIQWIPMKQSNKDMEMGDFLDKVTTKICGVFLADPVEIGQRTASNSGGMSASDNTEAKIDLSRDKGLLPILDMLEVAMNEHIMPKLAPGYIMRFTGINTEDEEKKATYLNGQRGITYREWRKAMGLDEEPEKYDQKDLWVDAPTDPAAQKIWMAARGLGQPQAPGGSDEEPSEGIPKPTDDEPKPVNKAWKSLKLA